MQKASRKLQTAQINHAEKQHGRLEVKKIYSYGINKETTFNDPYRCVSKLFMWFICVRCEEKWVTKSQVTKEKKAPQNTYTLT